MQIVIRSKAAIFISLGCLFALPPLNAQSPYYLDQNKEISLISIGVGLHIASRLLREEIDPFTAEQLSQLDREAVVSFERFAIDNYSVRAANASDLTRNICIALPLVLAAGRPRSEFGKVAVLLGETYLLVSGVTVLAKTSIHRPRPFVHNDLVDPDSKQTLNAQYSFISGHTSISSGLSFFAAKVFSDYYPESRLKPVVWTVAATIPALTGYFRVKAGKHYPSDVIAGYLVGAIGGILVPALHRNVPKSSNGGLVISAGGSRLRVVYQF